MDTQPEDQPTAAETAADTTPVDAVDGAPVDEKGGDFGAGLIKGVSVLSRGKANNVWADNDLLNQVTGAINAEPDGIKSSFNHAALTGDSMGKGIGRFKNATVNDDKVVADQHIWQSSHETPSGDLGGYLMKRAKEDPASFGASVMFDRDPSAEAGFAVQHGATVDEDGNLDLTGFQSPDADNVDNLPHARLAKLNSVDFVGEPAANPDGLFCQVSSAQQDSFAAFALGLPGADRPSASFAIDPDTARAAFSRVLAQRQLVVSQNAAAKHSGQDYMAAFGKEQGAVWFVEGLSFDDAQRRQTEKLTADLVAEKARNAELTVAFGKLRGEHSPVSVTPEQPQAQSAFEKEQQETQIAASKYAGKLSPGMANIAARIKLPANK